MGLATITGFAEPRADPGVCRTCGTRPMSGTRLLQQSKPGWNIAGIEYRVTHDCGAGAIARQGGNLNSGS